MRVLITGIAGFIGAHCAHKLLSGKHDIAGIDNFNNDYSLKLKNDRIQWLKSKSDKLTVYHLDISENQKLFDAFNEFKPNYVIHLAAQAGVRYSIENPHACLDSNLKGFLNTLEACRTHPVKHLIYAFSNSAYGTNNKTPYATNDSSPIKDFDWDAHNPSPSSSSAAWRILNIGGSQPIELLDYVSLLEKLMSKKVQLELLPLQPRDVLATSADTTQLEEIVNFKPKVSIEDGLKKHTDWFKKYYLKQE